MRLTCGDITVYELLDDTLYTAGQAIPLNSRRRDWLDAFVGELAELPVGQLVLQRPWLESMHYMAPENMMYVFRAPYLAMANYLGWENRVNGIQVKEIIDKIMNLQ